MVILGLYVPPVVLIESLQLIEKLDWRVNGLKDCQRIVASDVVASCLSDFVILVEPQFSDFSVGMKQ